MDVTRKGSAMVHRVAFLLLLGSMSLSTYGADIFRWVDENGKVHYGDSIPDRYKQKAKKIDPKSDEVTGAQRQEAQERVAREKAKAESIRKAREAKSDGAPQGSAPSTLAGDGGCEDQLKKYLESQTCFAPYRLKDGGIKPEAFQNCTEVKEPTACRQSPDPSSDRNYSPPAPK